MQSIKEIKKALQSAQIELKADGEEDFDNKLPCCDYRELTTTIDILEWVLKGE